MGTTSDMIRELQASHQQTFQMEDLGLSTYFLGLEVHQTNKEIFLHQHKYITDLIEITSLQNSILVDTPLKVNAKF